MPLIVRTPYLGLRRHYGNPRGWHSRPAWPVRESFAEAWSPRIVVANEKSHVTFRVELPGVRPEDLDVSVSDGIVTFKAEKQAERSLEREGYEYRETSTCSFTRIIPLPERTEWEKAEAVFGDGALEVTIPRAEPEAARHIPVHTASADESVEPAGPGTGSEEQPTGEPEAVKE